MCDYCDCRSHPAIATLSEDHEALLEQLALLRRAITADDPGVARAILEQLHAVLDVHASREERGVFRELVAADVDADYVGDFHDDHDAIHAYLREARSPAWRDAARAFAALLEDHIRREETDLFPAAHQLLQPHQWDAVDAAHEVHPLELVGAVSPSHHGGRT